ncbi:zinc-binding dehydrogenase [Pyxidicoccus sp. 3LG]
MGKQPGRPDSTVGTRCTEQVARHNRARALANELGAGRLQVRLGLVVELAQAAEAHRQLETRGTVGKVVLRVP